MSEKFELATIKTDLESGKITVGDIIKQIDERITTLGGDVEKAKALVRDAENTGGDFCGLGSKGRVTALARALSQTNETIADTQELIRNVIGLILCSSYFAEGLIKHSTELFSGQMTDADGKIVKISKQAQAFISSVIEIAKGLVNTQTSLKREVSDAKSLMETTFRSQMDALLSDMKKMEKRISTDLNTELKRQAAMDEQLEEKTETNRRRIFKMLKGMRLQRRSLARTRLHQEDGHLALILSALALVFSFVAVVLAILK